MVWVRIDDQLPDHPKALALGRRDRMAGVGLFVFGLCYANRYLTDGHVHSAALPPGSARLAARLVEVGLWEKAPGGGYQIHDFHGYQPSRTDVIELRAVRAEAGRAGGLRSGVVRRALAEAKEATDEAVASSDREPRPQPQPVQLPSSSPQETTTGREEPIAREARSDGSDTRPRLVNLYDVHLQLTERACTARERDWIDNLCHQHDRDRVRDLMYQWPGPESGTQLIGWVTHHLRHRT